MKALFIIFVAALGLVGCDNCQREGQQEVKTQSDTLQIAVIPQKKVSKAAIGAKLELPPCIYYDDCKSPYLDTLFHKRDRTYLLSEDNGTNFDDYNFYIINVFHNHKPECGYILLLDNENILRDTLQFKNEDISLDVVYKNAHKGLALGLLNDKDLYNVYFRITNLYEITEELKIKSLALNTPILECQIPLKLLTEEYVGVEDYFSYGIDKR